MNEDSELEADEGIYHEDTKDKSQTRCFFLGAPRFFVVPLLLLF